MTKKEKKERENKLKFEKLLRQIGVGFEKCDHGPEHKYFFMLLTNKGAEKIYLDDHDQYGGYDNILDVTAAIYRTGIKYTQDNIKLALGLVAKKDYDYFEEEIY